MKTGANSSDQITIKKLEEQGHSAKGISIGLNIDVKAVRKFMKNPDAEQNVDQGIDTALVEDLQIELDAEKEKVVVFTAKIDELVHTIEGLNETIVDQGTEISKLTTDLEAASEEGFGN